MSLAVAGSTVAWTAGSLRGLGSYQLSLGSPDLQSGHLPLAIKKNDQKLGNKADKWVACPCTVLEDKSFPEDYLGQCASSTHCSPLFKNSRTQ